MKSRHLAPALVLLMGLMALPSLAAPANPFLGRKLFVDPDSPARRQVSEWKRTRPADALLLERVAGQPTADWFGDWNRDVRGDVAARARQVRSSGAVPVFVVYNLPGRDLGSYSAGGSSSAEAYRLWIRDFADGLGNGPAAVVLEPDALGHLGQRPQEEQEARLALLRDAVQVLASHGAAVYLDAGHPRWMSPQEAAARLRRAGVDQARGFSLNVSNFVSTKENVLYGRQVSQLLGGKPFVIDTSRNGNGPDPSGQVINPPGRALGASPTASTGESLVDAFLWLKRPGESDGARDGAPPAGSWWADYALDLARRAGR